MVGPTHESAPGHPHGAGLFAPARRVRAFEDVVGQIQEAIYSGRLLPGDRLPSERDLCVTFGVSRASLREAMRMLETFGAVEVRPGSTGGMFVREPDDATIARTLGALTRLRGVRPDEVAEFAASIFAETAYWAAVRGDVAHFAALDSAAADLTGVRPEQPWELVAEIHGRFVAVLGRAARNGVRGMLVLGLHQALVDGTSSLRRLESPQSRGVVADELRVIATTVKARNARLARIQMRRHVQRLAGPASRNAHDPAVEAEPITGEPGSPGYRSSIGT